MNRKFDSFEYRLNLAFGNNTISQQQPNSNVARILITHETDAHKASEKLCIQNNLPLNLSDFIAQSIKEQIQKQIQNKILNDKQTNTQIKQNYIKNNIKIIQKSNQEQLIKKKEALLQKNNPNNNTYKSFKNKFCSYLNEIKKQDSNTCLKGQNQNYSFEQYNQQISDTFRNCDFIIDTKLTNPANQQYSFRPTYMKMLDLTYQTQLPNYQINQQAEQSKQENCQQLKNGHTYRSRVENKKRHTEETIFDHLYHDYILMQSRKLFQRKKSFEKMPFKPQLNKNSIKIIQIKKQITNNYQKIWQRSLQKTKRKQPFQEINKNIQKTPIDRKISHDKELKQRTQDSNNKLNFQSKNNQLKKSRSIYQRGQLYIKKSMEKLNKLKQVEIRQQMRNCTFKPTLVSKSPTKNIKTLHKFFF